MFIADLYRHHDARVWVIGNSRIATAWIEASLRRLLPLNMHAIHGRFAGNARDAEYDLIIKQSQDISNYAAHVTELAGEYLVEVMVIKSRYAYDGEFYSMHLPRDLAPGDIYKDINSCR